MMAYKEEAKSKSNPFLYLILWFVISYGAYILWGISEIIFEFNLHFIIYIADILFTIVFAWFFVTKIITVYEFKIEENKFIISKRVSKRISKIKYISVENIISVTNDKKLLKNKNVTYLKSYVRKNQDGKVFYIIFKNDKKVNAIKLKSSKDLNKIISKTKDIIKGEF